MAYLWNELELWHLVAVRFRSWFDAPTGILCQRVAIFIWLTKNDLISFSFSHILRFFFDILQLGEVIHRVILEDSQVER